MTSFLAEIGTKLADRWFQVLVLPGLLWCALLAAAVDLGQTHPFRVARLSTGVDQLAGRPATHAPGTVILAAAGILLASAGIGMAAGAGGIAIQHLWALTGDRGPASWLLWWRRRRWDRAAEALRAAIRAEVALGSDPLPVGLRRPSAERRRAQASVRRRRRRLGRLGAARPVRPMRTGDRDARTRARVAAVNGLTDLTTAWPRMWSVLPKALKSDITAARTAYAAAARLAAWGPLYVVLTFVWWPAALVGIPVLFVATVQARAAADVLADLLETAVDLHAATLAEHLGVPAGPTPVDTGHAITTRLSGETSGASGTVESSAAGDPATPPESTGERRLTPQESVLLTRALRSAGHVAITIRLSRARDRGRVEAAVDVLLEQADLGVVYREDPISSPWFRRIWASTSAAAAEPRHGHEPSLTASLLRGAATLVPALQDTEGALIHAVGLLVVKNEGVVTAYRLTAVQQVSLRKEAGPAESLHDVATALGLESTQIIRLDRAE